MKCPDCSKSEKNCTCNNTVQLKGKYGYVRKGISLTDSLQSMINGLRGVNQFKNVSPAQNASRLMAMGRGGSSGMKDYPDPGMARALATESMSAGPKSTDIPLNALLRAMTVRDPENPKFNQSGTQTITAKVPLNALVQALAVRDPENPSFTINTQKRMEKSMRCQKCGSTTKMCKCYGTSKTMKKGLRDDVTNKLKDLLSSASNVRITGLPPSLQSKFDTAHDKVTSKINSLAGIGSFKNTSPAAIAAALIASSKGGKSGMKDYPAPGTARSSASAAMSEGPRRSSIPLNALINAMTIRDPENPNFSPFKKPQVTITASIPSLPQVVRDPENANYIQFKRPTPSSSNGRSGGIMGKGMSKSMKKGMSPAQLGAMLMALGQGGKSGMKIQGASPASIGPRLMDQLLHALLNAPKAPVIRDPENPNYTPIKGPSRPAPKLYSRPGSKEIRDPENPNYKEFEAPVSRIVHAGGNAKKSLQKFRRDDIHFPPIMRVPPKPPLPPHGIQFGYSPAQMMAGAPEYVQYSTYGHGTPAGRRFKQMIEQSDEFNDMFGPARRNHPPKFDLGKLGKSMQKSTRNFGEEAMWRHRGPVAKPRNFEHDPPFGWDEEVRVYPDKDHNYGGKAKNSAVEMADKIRQRQSLMNRIGNFKSAQYRYGLGSGSTRGSSAVKSMSKGLSKSANGAQLAAMLMATGKGGKSGMKIQGASPASIGPRLMNQLLQALLNAPRSAKGPTVRDPENPNYTPIKGPSRPAPKLYSRPGSKEVRDPENPNYREFEAPVSRIRHAGGNAKKSMTPIMQNGMRHVVGGYRGSKIGKAMAASQTQTKNKYV